MARAAITGHDSIADTAATAVPTAIAAAVTMAVAPIAARGDNNFAHGFDTNTLFRIGAMSEAIGLWRRAYPRVTTV
jgi:hypothetical protein